MRINLTGSHLEVTPALREYVQDKFARVERHFDHVTAIHIILAVEKQRHKAEAELHVSGANLYAGAEHDDMYAAIDLMMDKLDRQVKKHKEKLTDHHRREARRR
ncbi:MAG TPA: ribosome-associated translation inhibitor RaiA [Gammaproteobacteria bacterium]|nr:ribosome-associated translation inhibitor RaiA [Gammaproteobacteria bacterium]